MAKADRSYGILTVTCPGCNTTNTFPEFEWVDIFICDVCDEPVEVVEAVQ